MYWEVTKDEKANDERGTGTTYGMTTNENRDTDMETAMVSVRSLRFKFEGTEGVQDVRHQGVPPDWNEHRYR